MMKGKNGRRVTCQWVAIHLDAYLDGELDAKQAEKLRAHLDECPACAAQAEEAKELLSLVAGCDDVVPDPSVHESIMSALGHQPQAQPAPSRRPAWRRLGLPLVGACLLLALLLIPPTFLRPSAPSAPADDPTDETPDAQQPSGKPSRPNDDKAGPPEDRPDSPSYDAPGCDAPDCDAPDDPTSPVPPAEEPDAPPESVPGGDMDETDKPEGEGVVYVLYRQTPVPEGETLWELLDGEWQGKDRYLVISCEHEQLYYRNGDTEFSAYVVLVENRLILETETGEILYFWVRLEGDKLWLTLLP